MRVSEVIVLDMERRFLDYVHPAFARRLIKDQAALVYSRDPFVIQVKNKDSLLIKKDNPNMISNFTEYFKTEKDVYVQNVSNCQVSVNFEVGPGHSESYLFTNSKDPVNLTRAIPYQAIKNSMDLRKMLNRVPAALKLLEEEDFNTYYRKQVVTHGLNSVDEALAQAEARRIAAQNHTPLTDAVEAARETETEKKASVIIAEADAINSRVLHLCLQVHPSVPDQSKMSAQQLLSELDSLNDMRITDWEYIQSHGFYKSVKNLAKKMVAELATSEVEEDEEPVVAPKKPAKKSKVTPASAE